MEMPYSFTGFQSGSLGKGTAVKGSTDIDLVVVFNGLGSMKKLKEIRPLLLDQLKEKVQAYTPFLDPPHALAVKKDMNNLTWSLHGGDMEILLTVDIVNSEFY